MGRPIVCRKCKNEFQRETIEINVICPICGIVFCNKTDTERILFEIQELYINKKLTKDKFIHKIYIILFNYTKSILLQNFRYRVKDEQEVEDYSNQALHYFLMYYIEDDDFLILNSFSGMLYHKVNQAINEKSNHASAEETINYRYDDGNENQIEDTILDDLQQMENYENRLDLLNYTLKFIFEFEILCNNKRENYIRLQALSHYLKYGEKKADILFKTYSRFGKLKYEDTLDYLHKELKKLWEETA